MGKKNVTFSDIAAYTGFSKTTISRYFNQPDSLTVENQDLIKQALIDLDYKENKVARILASGKTEYIGVILPNLYMHYYSAMLDCILSTYSKFGYKFLVFVSHDDVELERKYIQELMAYKVEGLIFCSHKIPSSELAVQPVPVITIEREDDFISSVNADNYNGGRMAAETLHKKDCDIYLFLDSPATLIYPFPGHLRMKGFQDYCIEHSIPCEFYRKDIGATFDVVNEKTAEFIAEIEAKYGKQKKGIFLSNDTYTNEFLNQLIRKYHNIPDDYYFIGFDNSSISKEAVYPFSTINQQLNLMVHTAMEILVNQMNERKKRRPKPLEAPTHKIIPVNVIERYSTDRNYPLK